MSENVFLPIINSVEFRSLLTKISPIHLENIIYWDQAQVIRKSGQKRQRVRRICRKIVTISRRASINRLGNCVRLKFPARSLPTAKPVCWILGSLKSLLIRWGRHKHAQCRSKITNIDIFNLKCCCEDFWISFCEPAALEPSHRPWKMLFRSRVEAKVQASKSVTTNKLTKI